MVADTHTAIRFLLAARQSEVTALRQLLQTCELVGAVSQLVHMLQRERGATNIYLCSDRRLYADAIALRIADVANAQRDVLALLAALEPGPAALPAENHRLGRVAGVLYALGSLPALRDQVRQAALAPAQVTAAFNGIIRTLLALVFTAADTAAEPVISRALIAMFSFMQGKELAGQERAVGAAGFAAREFSDGQRRQLLDLIEGQERCFDTFADFAEPPDLQRWRDLCGQEPGDFERLRRIAGTGKALASPEPDRSLDWFAVTTRRIDGMKTVEDGLAATLMRLCRASIAAAEGHPGGQPGDALLEELLVRQIGEQADYTVFMPVNGPEHAAKQRLSSDGLSPELGRSVVAMVRQQSRRLQNLADELAQMHATLNERQQIDRAKALLIAHRGLSEDEAYKTLRRMAMNQNKKLIEVAAALLAVEEVLKQ
ncbi:nitrate- and nitrite sensing domain-containing protein [Sodalis sp. RH21]|uniref:nitrate- and nitrite sensing domain-containing protein n=1 Tax=unclassified Sodalis (in: enterobacteria) TaxID=2636512 RepID=UPI0039B39194